MSEVVLKRPTKLQREVAKMRYERTLEAQQLKHNMLRNANRDEWIVAKLAADKAERERLIREEEKKRSRSDWLLSILGALAAFAVIMALKPPSV